MTDRFQGWRKAGVFKSLWIDGFIATLLQKAPLRGKGIGPNPIDRAKCGTKRSILVDGKTEHNSKIKHS